MTLRSIVSGLAGAAVGLFLALPAHAGDSNGNFQAKLGITGVWTDDDTKSLTVGGTETAPGNFAKSDDTVIPTLTLTYFLNKNLAVELFCCFDKVGVDAKGGLAQYGEIADTWIFPPILTIQYHFDNIGPFKPYVGAGAEWIHYFNSKSKMSGALAGYNQVDFDDSFGFALQAGVDYDLGGGWSFGLDVKKVWEDTKITWTNAAGAEIVAKHDLDPLFVTANLGYRFNLQDLFGGK